MSSQPASEAVVPVEGTSFHLEPRQKLEILFAILLALFLFALDQTVVGTALPVIVTDLHGENLYTWAVTIYLLTATISGPIYGKLSDLYGRRPIFIWALGLFLVASIGAGLSNQMWEFILFRGLQGLGGGAVFPIALAVVADLYPPQERAKYGALFGAVFGLASVLGPGIGGILTDNFGWQSIFFVNVPIVIVSLIICWRLLPPIKNPAAGRNIDYVGAALLAGAIGPIPGRPYQQDATGGLDRFLGRRADRDRPDRRRRLPVVGRPPRRRPHRQPAPLPQPQRGHLGGRHVLRRRGLLRRHHLPAALVPVRRRRQRNGVGLQPPTARHGPHRQRRAERPDRGPHRAATSY